MFAAFRVRLRVRDMWRWRVLHSSRLRADQFKSGLLSSSHLYTVLRFKCSTLSIIYLRLALEAETSFTLYYVQRKATFHNYKGYHQKITVFQEFLRPIKRRVRLDFLKAR